MGGEEPGCPSPYDKFIEGCGETSYFQYNTYLGYRVQEETTEGGTGMDVHKSSGEEDGRLDLDMTLCDHNMDVLRLSRQTIVALDAKRKFGTGKKDENAQEK
jgi:hypothetical protein